MRARTSACVATLVASLFIGGTLRAERPDVVGSRGVGRGHLVSFDLVYGNGTGIAGAGRGSQLFLRFDAGGFLKASSIGNLAGIEGGLEMGLDNVPRLPGGLVDYMAGIPFAMDAWLGFPVTLLNLGDGKDDWLRVSVAPGLGMSFNGTYLYVRAGVAAKVPVIGDADLTWTWWPDATHYPFGVTNDSINSAAVKASVYIRETYHCFVQYRASQRVHEVPAVNDDPNIYGGLPGAPGDTSLVKQGRYDNGGVITIGVGGAPF